MASTAAAALPDLSPHLLEVVGHEAWIGGKGGRSEILSDLRNKTHPPGP